MIDIDGKEVNLVLVKNPVGLNQVLNMIATDHEPFSLGFLLNAHYADGIDTSWIWDGNFEQFAQSDVRQYLTGGERYRDISTRLEMAGVTKLWEEPNLEQVVQKIKEMPTKRVYLLATYTAVLQLRKLLAEQKYIKGGMD